MRTTAILAASVALLSCGQRGPRTITVAQGDSAALQKAANLLRPGDTLSLGPGAFEMNNSLVVGSGVTVRGVPGKTILRKSHGVESLLAEDGDYGETFLAVAEPGKFRPGMGLSVLDDTLKSGWDVSVTSVVGVEGRYLRIFPMTLRDYDREKLHARVRNTFPILCAIDAENVVFDGLTVDGNKAENEYLDGCRGGAIYLYKVRNATVRNCVARNYNGDGISFQITDHVQVIGCESYGHTGYGVHPGTGSAYPVVRNCRLHDNGDIGLFLCWRVRHGRFADNRIEDNGHHGISIGHKDTDNEFVHNTVARNGTSGVYFREETYANSGHRNTFRDNQVLDNGGPKEGYGFYIQPLASDILIEGNRIADTRGTQRQDVFKAPGAGTVRLLNNTR